MDAIFLHQASCHLRDPFAAKERIEMIAQPCVVVVDVLLVALPIRHHVVFFFKLFKPLV